MEFTESAGMSSVVTPNEEHINILRSLICDSFPILCGSPELQRLMKDIQKVLSENYIKNNGSNIDYNPATYTKKLSKLTNNISTLIRELLDNSSNVLGTKVAKAGYSTVFKNNINTTKIIKRVDVGSDVLLNFNLFNEYIIQRLLHYKVNEINTKINSDLKMYIPNVYSFTKQTGFNKFDFIKMNYIDNHISLHNYITTYEDVQEKLFDNLNRLIINYKKYLRILQEEYSFIHYDMNLGNILLKIDHEHNISEFYLIDYGQSYINFNNNHFLGTVNHAFVTSLHANYIFDKNNGIWKSIDLIYLLLMIVYRFVEKNNYITIESGKRVIDITRIQHENPSLYTFITSHFINLEFFKQVFSIIYIQPLYFKKLILNYNEAIDIFLSTYRPISREDQQNKIRYIFQLFGKYKND